VRVSLNAALEVMRRTASRAPHLHCYGLHEWAMVYKPPSEQPMARHQRLPLRLSQEEVNEVVESSTLACTHFDAFRFFAPSARPTPSRAAQPLLEQPGCVHANMDLFKYAFKLFPHLPSDVLADALEVAIAARHLDMRASPYDLRDAPMHGFETCPIRIENEEGRREYQHQQVAVARRAVPVRRRLIECYQTALSALRDGNADGDGDGDGADGDHCGVRSSDREVQQRSEAHGSREQAPQAASSVAGTPERSRAASRGA